MTESTGRDRSPPPDRAHMTIKRFGILDRKRNEISSADASGSSASYSHVGIPDPTSAATGPRASWNGSGGDERRQYRNIRAHKHRPGSAFLLPDPIPDPIPDETSRDKSGQAHRRQRAGDGRRKSHNAQDGSKGDKEEVRYTNDGPVMEDQASTGQRVASSSTVSSMAPLDSVSAQIVKMALNLSESRRLAARTSTPPLPPRLAPLPDHVSGGSLRQHLQQQRRVSRTISPRSDRQASRMSTGSNPTSPPQPVLNCPDSAYRYHFSKSTRARAQQAKDHLELLAQYRRLLDLVPPWKHNPSAANSPSSPWEKMTKTSSDSRPKLGRVYNPLQYIRNRKVRARERKAVESGRFHDVAKVNEWVDDVARQAISDESQANGTPVFPPFESTDLTWQSSSSSGNTKSGVSVTKPKRPRLDWALDPAEMIADLYWLEQADNMKYIEDRHGRRIFPQDTSMSKTVSHEQDSYQNTTPASTPAWSDGQLSTKRRETKFSKTETEHTFSSARGRAQEKLRVLKGSHRRSQASVSHDLGHARISISDSSDTDSDRRRSVGKNAISSGRHGILEKQMMEMIARERRDAELGLVPNTEAETDAKTETKTERPPKRAADGGRTTALRDRRKTSPAMSEGESRDSRTKIYPLPSRRGERASLEVPAGGKRDSLDYNTSQPTSPDLRPIRETSYIPAMGMDFSPNSSRPSSPVRNPFFRVKSMFRDRSKECLAEPLIRERVDALDSKQAENGHSSVGYEPVRIQAGGRRPSVSPSLKGTCRRTDASHHLGYRSLRGMGAAKSRVEEGGISLRGFVKSPRLDSVLRSGVSRVNDLLWRRDESADLSSSSSDGSDSDQQRGRSRLGLDVKTTSRFVPATGRENSRKSFLDAMPRFSHAGTGSHGIQAQGLSRPESRQSTRFDRLKPPKIDTEKASSSRARHEAAPKDGSRATSRKSSCSESLMKADDRMISILAPARRQQFSTATASGHTRSGSRPDKLSTVSRREVARLRALLLSSAIKAMEMNRRARERVMLETEASQSHPGSLIPPNTSWAELKRVCADGNACDRVFSQPIAPDELYPRAAQALWAAMQASALRWQADASRLARTAAPQLHAKADRLRARVQDELVEHAAAVAEEADAAAADLVTNQRLRAKHVMDHIDRMMRHRHRRFRWARRTGWLALEWLVVGFMWLVWLVVVILRVALGLGRGALGAVRWLLWL